jgi:hypothetical protein
VIAAILLAGIAALAVPSIEPASAQQRMLGAGWATEDPHWRWTMQSRRVKVVLVAGSIGAFRDEPYGRLLHEWCENAEIRNISRVGYGGWQLYEHFRRQVIEGGRSSVRADGFEVWLLWNGGLNSASMPTRTNHYIRRAFRDAHRRGMRVVGMTLSPWGGLSDTRRWGGARALQTARTTRQIVDFVMGRSSPREALGPHAGEREVEPDAPWASDELADVRIDLYDSPLRHHDAPTRDLESMRRIVERDSRWRQITEPLPVSLRETQLVDDAHTLAELPRWFLRPEYHAFDLVHPNRAGHRAIAEHACPQLPASWACRCPEPAQR